MEDNTVTEATAPQPGVGESIAEQVPPVSTIARQRMIEIIAHNKIVQSDCREVLEILNARPELDASFCRLFGLTKQPKQ